MHPPYIRSAGWPTTGIAEVTDVSARTRALEDIAAIARQHGLSAGEIVAAIGPRDA